MSARTILNSRLHGGFTLAEILIVVLILAILAMIVVPKWGDAADEARESALATDLQTARRQIQLYTAEHNDRRPEFNEGGAVDTPNFIARMTGRTDTSGKLNPSGQCGPYLTEWPANPYLSGDRARQIHFHPNPSPPRHGLTGWYYSLTTGILYANSTTGAILFDPVELVIPPGPPG
ncbi:MAG: type II secretion system protein [Phycisphaerae bacterium]|nr:type II secretion system protein [Phycisphaerae bacterium]